MEIDNNFYWLSEKEDVLDYEAEVPGWYYHTPSKQYADFTALNDLPEVEVTASIDKQVKNDFTEFSVELKNTGKYIAFFVNVRIVEKESGNTILPVLWSDNYISLLPGEKRVLIAKIRNKYLKEKEVDLVIDGYNTRGKL